MADFRLERQILKRSYQTVAGVDEAGRGALFGPVVAAAVVFSRGLIGRPVKGWLGEVTDSKLLAPAKRRKLAGRILAEAAAVGVGLATSLEIDKKNIYWASLEAMRRAVGLLTMKPDYLLIDGFKHRASVFDCPLEGVVGGDRKCLSVAAASVIAKVVRDEIVTRLDRYFQGYNLAGNKGYGTRDHYQALGRRGPTRLHRLSFNLGEKNDSR